MKKILFITGTRADFGKLKTLIRAVTNSESFQCTIFATGMHMLSRYGFTVDEIYKAGFSDVYSYMNQVYGEPMELVTANTISGLSRFVQENKPDLIVVHGDRIEALAGAIVGALRNILVAHIEGGELSGTVDEIIRHSVSKLAHIHFVANQAAASRLEQLGEDPRSIYVIGSPDIDTMLSQNLPELNVAKEYYNIVFEKYSIAMLHPVTTELEQLEYNTRQFVAALKESQKNYVVVYPNNDQGCEQIFRVYEEISGDASLKFFPSLRFEYFLTLLKNAEFIIGNSSAGIREAPVYAIPTINIGTRQLKRYQSDSIINVDFCKEAILAAIEKAASMQNLTPNNYFGNGNSTKYFMKILNSAEVWEIPRQKIFVDLNGI